MFGQRRCALVVLCLSTVMGLESLRAAQSALTAAKEMSSKIWVGRYQEIEEYLKTAECLSIEKLAQSMSARCVLRPGGPAARMAWKPVPPGIYRGFFTSYKAEIAAYELDRLLKLDMVPPTVERQLQGNTGAATLWVENATTWKGDGPPGEVNRAEWVKQVARMTMFDALIGNRDRNQANVLRDGAWNLILLDHERSFGPATEISRPLSRIEKDSWDRALALTPRELNARLRPWLDETEIAALLERRDRMKAEIDRLIAEKGAAAVVLR
ncbi:MAG TPA: hypothetical protein VFO67_05920 [Gemmatimonadales bacterium]|nr:hypothetical protein [Gemmatimonadales bacterium]